jgi:hypothetical protein
MKKVLVLLALVFGFMAFTPSAQASWFHHHHGGGGHHHHWWQRHHNN